MVVKFTYYFRACRKSLRNKTAYSLARLGTVNLTTYFSQFVDPSGTVVQEIVLHFP